MNSNQSSPDYLGLLPTAILTLIGMSLAFIAINNFGLPVPAIAFSIAPISFSLAAYHRWISHETNESLRRKRIQIFIVFGVASLLVALIALLVPLPDRIKIPVVVQVFFELLMFGFVL